MQLGRPFNQNSLFLKKKKKEHTRNHLLRVTRGFLQETHDYLLTKCHFFGVSSGRPRGQLADLGRTNQLTHVVEVQRDSSRVMLPSLLCSTGHPLCEWPPHTMAMTHTHSPTFPGRKAMPLQPEKVFATTPKCYVSDSSCPLHIHAPPSPVHGSGAAMQLALK